MPNSNTNAQSAKWRVIFAPPGGAHFERSFNSSSRRKTALATGTPSEGWNPIVPLAPKVLPLTS
jgi:hypothetical protein